MGARIGLGVFVIVIAIAPLVLPAFYVTLLNYIGMATLVSLGLVMLTGVAGVMSFGQQAFVGLGAYATAVLSTVFAFSPWLGLVAGIVMTVIAALVLGAITLRLSGHYLPLCTIAWGISLYFLFGNLAILGQYNGLSGIPAISIGGWILDSDRETYYLIWAFALASLLAARNLLDSRSGRALRAVRFRGVMAESFGVDTAALKTLIFLYAAVLAGVAGWLYAHFLRFVSPHAFNVNAGIDYLFMAVIGGAANVWGAVIGASVLTVLKEWLKDILPKFFDASGNYEIVVFGLLMMLLLHRTRDGLAPAFLRLLPRRTPTRLALPVGAVLPLRAQPEAGEPLLALHGVQKSFGGLVAVGDLSFEMHAGEILGLIGPNGAGKSTVFNLITGVLPTDAGEIRFLGDRIDGNIQRDIAQRGIARTFQHVNLVSNMSVLENTAIGGHLRGHHGTIAAMLRTDRAEDARLLAEASRQLKRVGLDTHLFDAAGSLPLGKQRLAEIARALSADPILLLLDEPAAGLRYAEKEALATLLRSLRRGGMSILLVEHDMDFVMGLVDRLVVMDFGQRLAVGSPHEIQANEAVREAYLGGIS